MVLAVLAVATMLLAGLSCCWLLRGRLTRRLLAEDHLHAVARDLEGVKRAACRLLLASPADFAPLPRDPRVLVTRAGLLLFYTVSRDGSSYCHHLSLSVVGGYLPRKAGAALIPFLGGLLGIPPDRLQRRILLSTIHDLQFVLDEKEHAEFQARALQQTPSSLSLL